MPTYAYACGSCDHKFDAFQSIKAAPLRKCPECGKSTLRRLIGTGAGIIFKGSGFYITDYRSDGYKKAAEAETGGKTKTAEASQKKEAKAADKKEAKTESVPAEKKKSA